MFVGLAAAARPGAGGAPRVEAVGVWGAPGTGCAASGWGCFLRPWGWLNSDVPRFCGLEFGPGYGGDESFCPPMPRVSAGKAHRLGGCLMAGGRTHRLRLSHVWPLGLGHSRAEAAGYGIFT